MKPVIALQHVPHEGLGTIGDALARAGAHCKIVDAFAGPLPKFDPRDWSGLVVLGGPMNVDQTDRYPALAEEVRWLQQAVEATLPVLGICLGSQLLAKALGSKVFANRIKEIGWYEVELMAAAEEDALFQELAKPQAGGEVRSEAARKINVFQWHGDTFDLPAGAVQLASSEQCENQAFRFGESAYGLQFHMEVTAEIIDDWLYEGGNCGELAELNYINPMAIREQMPQKLPMMESMGRMVFDRFVKMCAQSD
ncbi:MAG TPA: gamma-glutamyl-gamma-aminobutyrate hydrolase family protein [Pirellulales bacterium]|jgi:GMP synthase (glutamine-hydrolysing)